jgi:putative redox protein
MKAYIKQVEGLTFAVRGSSNHWTIMDGKKEHGGFEGSSSPMEFVLYALGGCTAMDVISILNKMREPLVDFEMEIEATRADKHPKVYTTINMKYIFYGKNLNEENIKKAIQLSEEKYCSVSAMLNHSAEITMDYEIKNS